MTGNDDIRMASDPQQDFVNCGEDASGTDVDTARVSGNDLLEGTLAGSLTTTTGLSCERIIVDGVATPRIQPERSNPRRAGVLTLSVGALALKNPSRPLSSDSISD